MRERFDGGEDHRTGVREESENDQRPPGERELLYVLRDTDVLLAGFHVAADDDPDVGDVESHEQERVEGVDTAAQRDEERPEGREKEEGDLCGDGPVERDGVGEPPVAVPDGSVTGFGGAPDGEDGDARPADADQDPVRTGHVRDGEIGVVAGAGEARLAGFDGLRGERRTGLGRRAAGPRVPGVEGVDGVLGSDREHR